MKEYVLELFDNFIVGGIVALFTWFFGGLDDVFKILLALAVVDYLSGTCSAWYQNKLSSSTGFKGIVKKCIMFTFIGIANLIDKVMPGNSEAVKLVVCLFYIGNEGMSIIENADKIGIPIPEFLRKRFITMKKENDEHTKYEENHEYEHTENKLCNTEKSGS